MCPSLVLRSVSFPVSLAAFLSPFPHFSLTPIFFFFLICLVKIPLSPLSSRAGMFVAKFFEGCVPAMELQQEDKKLLALVGWELQQYIQLMDKVK